MSAFESFILFKTSSGNCYAYETKINQIFLLHPILYFILKKYNEKKSNKDWFEDLIKEEIIIDNHHIPMEEG